MEITRVAGGVERRMNTIKMKSYMFKAITMQLQIKRKKADPSKTSPPKFNLQRCSSIVRVLWPKYSTSVINHTSNENVSSLRQPAF